MGNNTLKSLGFLFVCLCFMLNAYGQSRLENTKTRDIRLGLNYGQASQAIFPFDNLNYHYATKYIKVQINYPLITEKTIKLELHAEPSIYKVDHQLLNKYFIKPESGPDYQERMDKYTQPRSYNEYVLQIGLVARYEFNDTWSTYLIGSTGPMTSEKETERLNKGFAFSNVVGLGLSYNMNVIRVDLRATIRHVSNADFYKPNHGYNSVGLESGISFQL